MTTPWPRAGCRVVIVGMLHSPARTRDCASQLVGRRGSVVGVLRSGMLALVALDGENYDLPGGVRRWSVHPDDLEVDTAAEAVEETAERYRFGMSDAGRGTALHAVPADRKTSLCGEPVRPLPTLGWSVPFSAAASRSCRVCARVTNQPARQASGRAP